MCWVCVGEYVVVMNMKQSWENKRDPVSSTFFLPLFKYSILSLIYALLIEEIKQAKCIVKCVNTLQSLSILSLNQLLYTKAPLKNSILCWKQIQKFINAKGETVTFFFSPTLYCFLSDPPEFVFLFFDLLMYNASSIHGKGRVLATKETRDSLTFKEYDTSMPTPWYNFEPLKTQLADATLLSFIYLWRRSSDSKTSK